MMLEYIFFFTKTYKFLIDLKSKTYYIYYGKRNKTVFAEIRSYCRRIPTTDKMAQEQASLDSIDDSFKKIIITQDKTKLWINEKGYVVINVLDLFLKENGLEL